MGRSLLMRFDLFFKIVCAKSRQSLPLRGLCFRDTKFLKRGSTIKSRSRAATGFSTSGTTSTFCLVHLLQYFAGSTFCPQSDFGGVSNQFRILGLFGYATEIRLR